MKLIFLYVKTQKLWQYSYLATASCSWPGSASPLRAITPNAVRSPFSYHLHPGGSTAYTGVITPNAVGSPFPYHWHPRGWMAYTGVITPNAVGSPFSYTGIPEDGQLTQVSACYLLFSSVIKYSDRKEAT